MVTITDERTTGILNELIRLTKDSAKGFKRAASELRDVEASEQAQKLDAMAEERAQMVDALQRAVAGRGEAPESGGTGSNALKRGWLNIKAAMTIEHDKTKEVIFEDRLSQEASVLEAYGSAMKQTLPSSVHSLVEKQQADIREQRERLSSMKERAS